MLTSAILILTLVIGIVLLLPRIAHAPLWRATVTPLASIIGSGFLVLGPILHASYGAWSPAVMLVLCVGAYLFGAAIRSNIAQIDGGEAQRSALEPRL